MRSLALFNDTRGAGKTTLTFNLAHMAARSGLRVVVLDYDPQCDLSSLFTSEEQLAELWERDDDGDRTIAACVEPVRCGTGAVRAPKLRRVADQLWLLPGHLGLSRFEQALAEEWPEAMSLGNERALDVTMALDMLANLAAEAVRADLVFVDAGPGLGALNRAALLCCDAIALPLAPDLFSLQGMRNVGPALRAWRADWHTVRERHVRGGGREGLPAHGVQPIGYIAQPHRARAEPAAKSHARWAEAIPRTFRSEVLGEDAAGAPTLEEDTWCLASIRHFASLVPVAQLARKPMFDLRQSDGIGGGQIQAVARCRQEFEALVATLVDRLRAAGTAPA